MFKTLICKWRLSSLTIPGQKNTWVLVFHCFLLIACRLTTNDHKSNSDGPLFTLLDATQTGIDFQNILTEGLNTNILMYEYFYNGSGVAAGDLNDDGKLDLYFTANMSDNKVYLNKGKMQFEDITLICGASGRPGPWKTGVSMVDINADGRLDIFVSHSGALPEEKRKNELFINQGNNVRGVPMFEEQAEKYGLAGIGYTTQSYFFDFDKDGDLDVLLLQHNPKNLPMLNEGSTAQLLAQDDLTKGTRLLKNNAGMFEDVTASSGINGSPLSYGLGVGISDVNKDGWPDIYLSNDYNVPDYLYINNQKGRFINQLTARIDHTSQFSMGNEVADVNNDGWPDVFTLDMLPEDNKRQKLLMAPDNYNKFELNVRSGFYYQYMRNMLHLNTGDGHFIEVGQMAGISNTDWSWSALMQDFNDDGFKDLHITNGYKRDYTNLDFINYMDEYVKSKGRLLREDVLEIIKQMPSSDVSNYIFSGSDSIQFIDRTSDWGLKRASNSNGALYADLDDDGDLDIVVNNINQPAFIYKNERNTLPGHHYLHIRLIGAESNQMAIGAVIEIKTPSGTQCAEQYLQRGYQSSVTPIIHFGLGQDSIIDQLVILWPTGKRTVLSGVKCNQSILCQEADATSSVPQKADQQILFKNLPSVLSFKHDQVSINDFDRQVLLHQALSYRGPCFSQGLLNEDNLTDVVFGGSNLQDPFIAMQLKDGTFSKQVLTTPLLSGFEGGYPVIFDANQDGKNDVLIPATGHTLSEHEFLPQKDLLFIQKSNNRFEVDTSLLPYLPYSKSVAIHFDGNGDGLEDVFMAGCSSFGKYPAMPPSYLLINQGAGKFKLDAQNDFSNLGMVSHVVAVDMNLDKRKDLILVGEWMPVKILINHNGLFKDESESYFDKKYLGWWNTILVQDFNQDGQLDLMVGNHGENSQLKASSEQPVQLHFKDFDKNGSLDPILTSFIQGKRYPFVSRDELLKQLPVLKQRFNSFEKFANADLNDVFTKEELDGVQTLTADHLATSLFLSKPDHRYTKALLPWQCQLSPVYCISPLDFNFDGQVDLLLTGNNTHYKIRLGQMDANHGVLLENAGKGVFKFVESQRTGLNIRGDVRSVVTLEKGKFLFGINNGEMIGYQLLQYEKAR